MGGREGNDEERGDTSACQEEKNRVERELDGGLGLVAGLTPGRWWFEHGRMTRDLW